MNSALKAGKWVGGKALDMVAKSKIPERLWTSAAKPSMGGKLNVKDTRVATALKEGITPDRQGLEKATSTISGLNDDIDNIITGEARQGASVSRDVSEVHTAVFSK